MRNKGIVLNYVRDKQQKFVFTNLSTVLYCSQCENKKFGKGEYRRLEGKKFVAPLSSRGANRVYARNKAGIAKRHFETSHLRFQEVQRRRAPWKTGTVALPFNPFAPPRRCPATVTRFGASRF